MKRIPTGAIVLFMALLASPDQAAATSPKRLPLVESIDIQIPSSPIPVTIAGERHLAYELHVTNFRPYDVELNRLEVIEPASGRRIAQFSDSQLATHLGRVGARVEGPERRTVIPGGRTIVYLWLRLPDRVALPTRLRHEIEVDLTRPSGSVRTIVTDEGCTVRHERPIALNAPLRGGPWVALYDPTMMGGHRTSIYTLGGHARIPDRFAIDLVKLAEDGSRARGDVTSIANWHGYGSEVLAVADGTVAEAADDLTESASISEG